MGNLWQLAFLGAGGGRGGGGARLEARRVRVRGQPRHVAAVLAYWNITNYALPTNLEMVT